MIENRNIITRHYPYLNNALVNEICRYGQLQHLPKGAEVLREGQFVKVVPLLISGLLKVFSRYEDRELLVYYIRPEESCIMSFYAGLNGEASRVFAVAEEDSEAVLLPATRMQEWTSKFTSFNSLFFKQYNQRYTDLLDTINHLLFHKMDQRIYDYLKEKSELTGRKSLKMKHQEIANELGTAREVISRTIKKLEAAGKLRQTATGIEVL